jgi:ribonuclease HI
MRRSFRTRPDGPSVVLRRVERSYGSPEVHIGGFSHISGLCLGSTKSSIIHLLCSGPKGSVLYTSELVHIVYIRPDQRLVEQNSLQVCLYADETRVSSPIHQITLTRRSQSAYFDDAASWILSMWLQLNCDRTGFLWRAATRHQNQLSLTLHAWSVQPHQFTTCAIHSNRYIWANSRRKINSCMLCNSATAVCSSWVHSRPTTLTFPYSRFFIISSTMWVKKSNTSPDLYLSLYTKLVSENYEGYDKVFSDGSKQGICVAAAAAVSHDKVLVKRLPNHESIFSAEAIAILLALDIISQSTEEDFLILSDSVSCVNAVENRNLENRLVVEILERVHQQLHVDRRITFVWVPNHMGIAGNAAVDAVAKAGVSLPISNAEIPHTDFKPLISSHVKNCWQLCWNSDNNNKLFKIQPVIKSVIVKVNRLPRRDETLNQCVGHIYLIHSYLLRRETRPECDFCHVRLTVEHLLSCCTYNPVRRKFYNVNSLQELLERVKLNCLSHM